MRTPSDKSEGTSSAQTGPSATPAASEAYNSSSNAALDDILYPADSYTSDRVYWADLPWAQKSAWANKQSNAEARRELGVIGSMFKQDPLSPIRSYFSNYVITGLGLFVEGYVLFSVGNIKPLLQAVWPACWKTHTECDVNSVAAVDYLQIIGIIVGQILVGIEGDWIGRRFGMVQDALVMTLGSVMLTAMWGTSQQGWVALYAISLFIYGIGVGGEYPMTSTRAMEASVGAGAGASDRMHRGRKVALAFTMQGWGQFINQAVLIILLLIFHNTLSSPFSKTSVQWTFRVSFGIIIIPTLYLAYIRFYKLAYTDTQLREAKARNNVSGYDVRSLKLATSHYWHRMVGTALVWFANDVVFYGAKIFSGVFISIITGGSASLGKTWQYNLINTAVSLAGYYFGAMLIDHKMYGRKWMQANGLIMIFILYLISAALYPQLTQPGSGVRWFQAIYFLSSFFTQFGPNTTSFLLAAEVYPTSIRSTAHGVSAAVGKLGALLPAVLYNYIESRTKFWFVCWFGLVAWALTLVFVPDTTGLDLRELDRYWNYVMDGRAEEYHGVAVNPRHLSLWERLVNKRHLAYNPELDKAAKIQELQSLYASTKDATKEGGEREMTQEQKLFVESELGTKLNAPTSTEAGSSAHQSKLADLERRLS